MAKIKTLIDKNDETIYPVTKGEAVVLNSGKNVEGEIASIETSIEKLHKPYLSLESKGSYLYEVTFDDFPEYKEVGFDASGCSSFVRDGKLYRNLDWKYDKTAEFVVKYNDGHSSITGMSFISQLTQSNLDDELIGQLPYHISDGVNQYGIMVATHVIFNDWGWKKSTYGGIPLNTIPLRILESIHTMTGGEWEDLAYDLFPYMEATPAIQQSGYLLQFLVTDGITTKVIIPPDSDGQPYTIVDATSNPKLTNFRWVDSASVVRTNLQTRPTGVERWNMMPSTLSELRFTKAYESANRLSEFIGLDNTTKDSTDEQLTTIYNKAKAIYDTRSRDGQTWQTMHSVVYSNHGMEELYIQENWNINYASGLRKEEVNSDNIDWKDVLGVAGGANTFRLSSTRPNSRRSESVFTPDANSMGFGYYQRFDNENPLIIDGVEYTDYQARVMSLYICSDDGLVLFEIGTVTYAAMSTIPRKLMYRVKHGSYGSMAWKTVG